MHRLSGEGGVGLATVTPLYEVRIISLILILGWLGYCNSCR